MPAVKAEQWESTKKRNDCDFHCEGTKNTLKFRNSSQLLPPQTVASTVKSSENVKAIKKIYQIIDSAGVNGDEQKKAPPNANIIGGKNIHIDALHSSHQKNSPSQRDGHLTFFFDKSIECANLAAHLQTLRWHGQSCASILHHIIYGDGVDKNAPPVENPTSRKTNGF